MFLTGTILNVVTVLLGTTIGLLAGLRMLDVKQVRVVNLLPALLLAAVFVRVADLVRAATGG